MSPLLLAALLAQVPTPEVPAPATWSATVGAGVIALTGNSQALTGSANAALEHKSPQWIWSVKAFGAYGQMTAPGASSSQVSALNAGIEGRGDRRLTERLSIYLLAGADTDHLKDIEARPYAEIGASSLLLDLKEPDLQRATFRTDLGFRYGRELRFHYYPSPAQLADVDIVAPRLGALARYAVNAGVIVSDEISALINLKDTTRLLLTNSAKLSARLMEKVSFGVSFVITDDSVPPPGKVSVDTALTVGLEVGL